MKVDETIVLPRPLRASSVSGGRGVDWNLESADSFARGTLPGAARDLAAAVAAGRAHGYVESNPYFGFADAAVAYALVRERGPGLVVEVGGGYSSRVLRTALDANGGGRLVTIDPEPRADLTGVVSEHRKERVEDVPLGFFEALPADSVLFIDSSHRAGTGSDVNFLFLEVLPALSSGVLVHVHDVFLPDDYPAALNLGPGGWNYTEQHLLHALLVGSSLFRMVWPGRHVFRTRGEALHRLLPEWDLLGLHCSFWLERT